MTRAGLQARGQHVDATSPSAWLVKAQQLIRVIDDERMMVRFEAGRVHHDKAVLQRWSLSTAQDNCASTRPRTIWEVYRTRAYHYVNVVLTDPRLWALGQTTSDLFECNGTFNNKGIFSVPRDQRMTTLDKTTSIALFKHAASSDLPNRNHTPECSNVSVALRNRPFIKKS